MMTHTVVRIRPGRTILGAFFLAAIGYGIGRMGWESSLPSLVAIGGGIIVFAAWIVFVSVRHAARIARLFVS